MAAISSLTIAATPQTESRECINSLSNNDGFGFAIAVNDKYLAITELHKNRVAVYSRDNSGQWVKSQEIEPPKDSIHGKIDNSFGRGLQLDGDVLAINAISYGTLPGQTSSKESYGRYLVRLDSKSKMKEIDLPVEKKEDSILFNVLKEGEIKQITISNNGEKGFASHNGFNYNFAFDNNLLLVGSPSYPTGGGGWLFDLDRAEEKPIKISMPDTFIGGSVVLNDRFAAVGNLLLGNYVEPNIAPKTIVRAIDNGSTAIINAYGELSLSGDILAIMRFGSLYSGQTNLLKVFRLDQNAKPKLITEREDSSIERAWVQNGFLTTVESHYDPKISASRYIRVCLEPVH